MIHCHRTTRCYGALIVVTMMICVISSLDAVADPMDQDVFTDFETINTAVGAPFDVGTGDAIATFSGDAFSGVIGIGELYSSGLRAWMVGPAGVGTITFERNATVVEFFARTRSIANGNTIITAFDDDNAVVGTPVILTPAIPGSFELVSLTGNIDRIEFLNLATGPGSSSYNGIDDFGFTPIAAFTPTADFDDDGDVDGDDFLAWQRGFGPGPGANLDDGDGDGDGDVDADDLALWIGSFGTVDNIGANVSSVPEPANIVLLLAGLSLLISARVHRCKLF